MSKVKSAPSKKTKAANKKYKATKKKAETAANKKPPPSDPSSWRESKIPINTKVRFVCSLFLNVVLILPEDHSGKCA